MARFSREFIAQQRGIAAQATPRPWEFHNTDDQMCMNAFYITREGGPDVDLDRDIGEDHREILAITLLQSPRYADHPQYEENTEYILASANYYPAALDEIERLRSALEKANDILDVWDCEGCVSGQGEIDLWNVIREALKKPLIPDSQPSIPGELSA